MTRVCLVGDDDVELRYELLSRETSRKALATYDLRAPYENTVGVETVSLGAAVSLLNDLNWYLIRFVADALVLEPSVSEDEWLSRDLATEIRDDERQPAETGRLLKVYGVERPDDGPSAGDESPAAGGGSPAGETDAEDSPDEDAGRASTGGGLPRLVEPMLVSRTDGSLPEYDLRDVDDTLIVRVTEAEFEAA